MVKVSRKISMFRPLTLCAFAVAICLHAKTGLSMTFEPELLGGGAVGVRATGDITDGDADRLREALEEARPTLEGWIPLLLSSTGGEHAPALEMADIIWDRNLMPVVLPGDSCESACSTILLLAGKRSLVSEGGTLFYHACVSPNRSEAELRICNQTISDIMKERFGISDKEFLETLNGFVGDETEVPREDRLLHAPVVDCLGIDLPPWQSRRPAETRCGPGDLLTRDPMTARYDVDPGTLTAPEAVPGTAHPVWFLIHWTPPDQWAYWRVGDGVGVAMRPRGTFRNGPQVRIFCGINPMAAYIRERVFVDLRLPVMAGLERAHQIMVRAGATSVARVGLADQLPETPWLVDSGVGTQRLVAEFENTVWADLSAPGRAVTVSVQDPSGRDLWTATYTSAGLASRVPDAQKHCVGDLTPRG